MRIKRRQIVIGLALIVGWSALVFFMVPNYQSILTIKQSTVETRVSLDEIQQLSQRNSSLAEKYRALEVSLNKLNDRLLSPANALNLITALESLANEHSLAISVNKLEAPLADSQTGQIDLSVSGSLSNALKFLRQIESDHWLVTFDTVSLAAAPSLVSSVPNATPVTLSLVGETYWSN